MPNRRPVGAAVPEGASSWLPRGTLVAGDGKRVLDAGREAQGDLGERLQGMPGLTERSSENEPHGGGGPHKRQS